jgi:hypothetical protein
MNVSTNNPDSNFKERYIIPAILVVGVFLATLFSLRVSRSLIRVLDTGIRPGPDNVDTIRGWMTMPFIARVYRVPEGYLYQQTGISPQSNPHQSLDELNRRYYPGQPGVVVDKVRTAILSFRNNTSRPESSKNGFNI